jgi:hypothetical protein
MHLLGLTNSARIEKKTRPAEAGRGEGGNALGLGIEMPSGAILAMLAYRRLTRIAPRRSTRPSAECRRTALARTATTPSGVPVFE